MFFQDYIISKADIVFKYLDRKYKKLYTLVYPDNGILIVWNKLALLIKPDKSFNIMKNPKSKYVFISNELKELNYINLKKFSKAPLRLRDQVSVFNQFHKRKIQVKIDDLEYFNLNNYRQAFDIRETRFSKEIDFMKPQITIYPNFVLSIRANKLKVIFAYRNEKCIFEDVSFYLSDICSSISFEISYDIAIPFVRFFSLSFPISNVYSLYISKEFNLIAFESESYVFFIEPENILIEN